MQISDLYAFPVLFYEPVNVQNRKCARFPKSGHIYSYSYVKGMNNDYVTMSDKAST